MEGNNVVVHPKPVPLPVSYNEILAMRQSKRKLTYRDLIEEIHLMLCESEQGPEYIALCSAVWREDAVHGSIQDDNTMAAVMILTKAREIDRPLVYRLNLAEIRGYHSQVLKLYGMSRFRRRKEALAEIAKAEADVKQGFAMQGEPYGIVLEGEQ